VTTTLRPTGPERRGESGSRARSYDICVNARPVGLVILAADPAHGALVGRIEQLAVDEGERHRGRGAVAALAAEEVLRQWGCRRVEAGLPADASAGLHLARALGYTERSRNMLKRLAQPPRLPPGSAARPLADAETGAWREPGKQRHARALTEHGVPRDEAERRAAAFHTLLPQGASTPGAALRVLSHDGTDVGTLWLQLDGGPRPDADAFVYDVEVTQRFRGRGHGRTLMLLAEREALAAGAGVLGLNVFAENLPALRLYASLGYQVVTYELYKPLN
jgi:GNAT superfamily N-acetyltransferase